MLKNIYSQRNKTTILYRYIAFVVIFSISFAVTATVNEPLFLPVNTQGALSGGIATVIVQDKDGFLWFGSQDGLVRYDGYDFRIYQPEKNRHGSIAGSYIRSLSNAPDGKMWIGTLNNGVAIYDPKSDSFSNL